LTQQISEGKTALEAYDYFLQLQKKTVFPNAENGTYEASDVLAVAKTVQQVLRKSRVNAKDEAIIMAGSFPNGRAKLSSSDVDLQIPNLHYENLMAEMTKEVNQLLQLRFPTAQLEVNSMFFTTTPVNAAIVSPLQIRISRDSIELQVFDPIKNKDHDEFQLDFNYPPALKVAI
jgi:hypothetical protein